MDSNEWKLVPVEPTAEMLAAAEICYGSDADVYAFMLAAAPQPPAVGGGPAIPELVSLADIPYANKPPESWDSDYRNIWQQLQVAQHNKAQLHEYDRTMRAHVARLQADFDKRCDSILEELGSERDRLQAEVERQSTERQTYVEATQRACKTIGELRGLLRDAVGEIDYYRGDKHACKGLDIDAARAALAGGKEHE